LRYFCLRGSLRGRGWLRGDADERDKQGRAAGTVPGTTLGPGKEGTDGGGLCLGTSAALSKLQQGSSPLTNI